MGDNDQYKLKEHTVRSKKVAYDDGTGAIAVIDVPAKTLVKDVRLVITTAFSAGATVDVGDDAQSDNWVDNTDVTETTAGVYRGDGGDAGLYSSGKYYTSADTIDVLLAGTLSAGECYVVAEMLDLADVV